MTIREIIGPSNPVLRRKAKAVDNPNTAETQRLIEDMIATMRDAPGVGLAAPQVAVSQRIVVIEYAEVPDDLPEDVEPPEPKLYIIVNPEIVRQQIEGGLIHGISAAVGAPVEIVDGTPTARSIGAYRLPTLRDAPEVTVELIDSDEEPGGVTELAVPTAAPAVANALFSLTGQRYRTLPIVVGSRA